MILRGWLWDSEVRATEAVLEFLEDTLPVVSARASGLVRALVDERASVARELDSKEEGGPGPP